MDGIGNWDDNERDSGDELESVDNSDIGRVVTWVQTSEPGLRKHYYLHIRG